MAPDGPPPVPVPGGGSGNAWKWNPNPQNSRGGTWGPETPVDGQSQPSGSWDPEGHWDIDDGLGNRDRYDEDGNPMTEDEAHRNRCVDIATKGAAAAGAGYLIYRGARMIPSLIPWFWPTIPANLAIP